MSILLRFVAYLLVMTGFAVAVVLLPGWWWVLVATLVVFSAALGVARGLGLPWARRASRWLSWPDG